MSFDNQYLTYTEYEELGGKLAETPFNLLEFRARKMIDNESQGRLINLSEQVQEVKLCDFELINEINSYNKTGNKSSESVGSYAVSFNKLDTKEQKRIYKSIIENYLSECKLSDGTPYLYCGV